MQAATGELKNFIHISGGISTIMVLVSGGQYSVLASTDLDLGGNQATEVQVQFLGAELKQEYKEDITKNKRGKVKLATGAETVKHVLSTLFCREFV